MVKAKQKTVRIFDIVIDNEADFFPYMEKNLILLREYLLLLSGDITPKVIEYLDQNSICFIQAKDCNIKFSSKQNIQKTSIESRQQSTNNSQQNFAVAVQEPKIIKTLLLEKPVRSGEEILHDGDITIFGRVNSAAKVISEGNIEIYGTIDGLVQCDGDYMIIKDIGKGYVVFNGDILDKDQFDGNLKRVTHTSNGVAIKDIF